MRSKLVFGITGIGLLALGACSTGALMPEQDYGRPHFVEANGETPAWVDSPGRFAQTHKDRKYFVGADSRCVAYDVCRDVATGEATRQAAIAIKDKVHALLEVASTDDSTVGTLDVQRAIESGTLQTAFGVLYGVSTDRYFWQKYWVKQASDEPVIYYRNVYALVSISNDNWKRSVYETLMKKAEQVHDPRARALLKKMESRWLNKK
ncbi:MAG: hypothetical protein ACYDBP_07255 [Leptospirales bacterium]